MTRTRTRMTLLLSGGLLIGLTACGSTDTTTVSSIAPASDSVSTSAGPAATPAATSTTSTVVASASGVAVNGAKPSTTVVTTAAAVTTTAGAAAAKADLSVVLALVDSAEQSGAAVDKELNTANNAMNSTEQDPQA